MNNNPSVSVIIPAYNKAPYISRAIHSVLEQDYKNFELLIICDPSTDNTQEIALTFEVYPQVRVFQRAQPGPGGYAARNFGIEVSKGEWIAFLDADDKWYSDHLKHAMNVADSDAEVDLITSARMEDNSGKHTIDGYSSALKEKRRTLTLSNYLSECIYGRRAIGTNSVVAKKKLFSTDVRFPEGRAKRSGDLYLWVKLLAKSKKAVWSSHIASLNYRDVADVSKSSVPSMKLNKELVLELQKLVSSEEITLLRIYVNRLMKKAYFEQRKLVGVAESSLRKSLFWKNDFIFCSFYTLVSIFPIGVFALLRKIKIKLLKL